MSFRFVMRLDHHCCQKQYQACFLINKQSRNQILVSKRRILFFVCSQNIWRPGATKILLRWSRFYDEMSVLLPVLLPVLVLVLVLVLLGTVVKNQNKELDLCSPKPQIRNYNTTSSSGSASDLSDSVSNPSHIKQNSFQSYTHYLHFILFKKYAVPKSSSVYTNSNSAHFNLK